ncbi:MAG: DUF4382 domain-containing protein [Dehalococcoidales bacterium]|nr:MAG: DUF4382 domain-containing protein [Dehalococcoidales bacterium]
MAKRFNEIIDECINRVNRGDSIEDCLADYPEHAGELEPMLKAMLVSQQVYEFVPSPVVKDAHRQRFNAALAEQRRRREAEQPLYRRLFGQPRVWATVTVVVALAVAGYFGLKPVLFPAGISPEDGDGPDVVSPDDGESTEVIIAQPSLEGNFVFLISDEVNAIGDFSSVNITVSKIGLKLAGDGGKWVELEPVVAEVDLTLLQGDKAREVWQGDVPLGQYNQVFIYVDSVTGVLNEDKGGGAVEIKLPSGKLHMSKAFEVTGDTAVNFVYDLTVVAAGNAQGGAKYILKPQIAESGAEQRFELVGGQDEDSGKGKERGDGQDTGQGDGQDKGQGDGQDKGMDINQDKPR